METVTLKAIKFGETDLPENMLFRGGEANKKRTISLLLFLITFGNKRILVDAGCDTLPGLTLKNFCGPEKALRSAGIAPEDISDVVITHAHHDHIQALYLYKNAKIHIHAEELADAGSYIPRGANVVPFVRKRKLCGCASVIFVGGHSVGSSIVEIDAAEKIYLAGDECYTRECLEKQIPTGSSFRPEVSETFIRTFRDKCVFLPHQDDILPGKCGSVTLASFDWPLKS